MFWEFLESCSLIGSCRMFWEFLEKETDMAFRSTSLICFPVFPGRMFLERLNSVSELRTRVCAGKTIKDATVSRDLQPSLQTIRKMFLKHKHIRYWEEQLICLSFSLSLLSPSVHIHVYSEWTKCSLLLRQVKTGSQLVVSSFRDAWKNCRPIYDIFYLYIYLVSHLLLLVTLVIYSFIF